MGILPLEFLAGETAESLGLTGLETYTIEGLAHGVEHGFGKDRSLEVKAVGPEGEKRFRARVRLDTPQEVEYYKHGGILRYVLRQLAES
jgi:aconitate hydratase